MSSLADFSVSVSEVVEEAPIMVDNVGPDTWVSEANIEDWIQDAESDLAEILRNQDKTLANLTKDQNRKVQVAVESYAVAELLDKLGAVGDKYDKYRKKWTDAKAMIRDNDDEIGSPSNGGVVTNISDTPKPREDFCDPGYQY